MLNHWLSTSGKSKKAMYDGRGRKSSFFESKLSRKFLKEILFSINQHL
ncbi:MAG: hypothetical protein HRF40_05040 [Nitrososphaera sp.]